MKEAQSAWTPFDVTQISPDGRYRATIRNPGEVAMGAPTLGTLRIERAAGGALILQVPRCNPSFVWSEDSTMLAVPQWTPYRRQWLVLIHMPIGELRQHPVEYRVLELAEFRDGVIYGIDSPICDTHTLAIPISDFPPAPRPPHANAGANHWPIDPPPWLRLDP